MSEYLNFLGTTIRFDVSTTSFDSVKSFFRGLFSAQPTNPTTFFIEVHDFDADRDVDSETWNIPQSVIRQSTAPEFTFLAHVVDSGQRRTYVNRTTKLDTPRNAKVDNRFRLGITPGSMIQVIDFVRDLVIRNEEQRGTVVLHASAVSDGHRVVAIAGPKGAGKTTAMLSAMRHTRWRYFTGDKLFCEVVDGAVRVHPWRDFPHIGVGSILRSPELASFVRQHIAPDLDSRPAGEKLLMDPDQFESWLGIEYSSDPRTLAAVVLPRVTPGEPFRVVPVTDENERFAHLNKIVDRQADTTFFTWQSYLVPNYTNFFAKLAQLPQFLSDVPMIRLTGTLDVDIDSLLGDHR